MRVLILVSLAALAATAANAATRRATLGQPITLAGSSAELIRVTPSNLRVVAPGEFDTVRDSHHLVAVDVKLRNVGKRDYRDSPSNGAALVTRAGRVYDPSLIFTPPDCDTKGQLRIPRGASRVTCLAFEVPRGARLRAFEFALNSGYADMAGQWAIRAAG